ncbi:MAG: ABC transporter permease [Sporichthyaceae bacterium]
MSTTAAAPVRPRRKSTLVGDSLVIARRGLVHLRRQPEALSDATIQPVMFVLLFAYVFGGAIAVPGGGDYKEFLMGGIFAQTIIFGCFGVAVALCNDRNNGAIERFHSMPIAPSAVLVGHALTSLARCFIPIAFMSVTGAVVGWRIRGGFTDTLIAYGLMVGFSFAMIWVGVLLGSALSSIEAVQGVSFVVIFPITFAASTFVPVDTLPGALKTFAEWNPVTTLSEALRVHFHNPGGIPAPDAAWPIQHSTAYTCIWMVAIIAITAPLAVRLYWRANRG